MRRATLTSLLVAAACSTGPPRYSPGPPTPSADSPKAPPASSPSISSTPSSGAAPKMIDETDAVAAAKSYARSQGFVVGRVKHVHLDGAGRWHVDLVGEKPQEKANLLVDGWTGQVLKATLKDEED